MKAFQIVFHNGLVQNVMADNWKCDGEWIRFKVSGSDSLVISKHELLMIDDLDEGYHYSPDVPAEKRKRQWV